MAQAPRTIKLRGPAKWIDRRLLRSGLYAFVLVILFLVFTTSEKLFEHYLAGGENQSLVAALLIALGLAVLLQIFHKRVEDTFEHWLNRRLYERQKGLAALAREITLIREHDALERRVVERLDQLLATEGTALYLNRVDKNFQLACATIDSHPHEVSAEDPGVIHLRLQHEPLVPGQTGSSLSGPMLWPIRVKDV